MRILALSILVFSMTAGAADQSTYTFLRNDVGARSAAMAGSFVSIRNDANSMFYNPAGLATVEQSQLSIGYFKHLFDINAGTLAYTQDFEGGKIGGGINYINYGTFDETDVFANKLGTFTAGDLAVSLTYANTLEENLFYGVTGKLIYSSIAEARSSAVAGDIGLLYFVPGNNPFSLGVSLLNIGTQLNPYIDTREELPFEVKVGVTVKPQHLPLLLNIAFNKLNEKQDEMIQHFRAFSLGGEFTVSKPLRFRFGYHNERRKELKIGTSAGLAGFSFGAGIVMENVRFDYAYTSLGKIGSLNRITVGLDL